MSTDAGTKSAGTGDVGFGAAGTRSVGTRNAGTGAAGIGAAGIRSAGTGGGTGARGTASRPKLGRDVVIDAALRIADAEGLDAVTIRRLAQDLGVTPMALYWHFTDKEALLDAIGDRIWEEASRRLAATGGPDVTGTARSRGAEAVWTRMRTIMGALIDAMRDHPAVAERASLRVTTSEAGLDITEQALALLTGQGLDHEQAAGAARFVLINAVTLVTGEPGAEIATDPEQRAAVLRTKRLGLATLPPDRYPNVVAAAEFLVDCGDVPRYYERSIDAVIGGIRSQTPPRRPSRR